MKETAFRTTGENLTERRPGQIIAVAVSRGSMHPVSLVRLLPYWGPGVASSATEQEERKVKIATKEKY